MLALIGCTTKKRNLQRFEYAQPQMGVPFRIVLYAVSKPSADAAAEAAFARIQQLNDILSDYDTDSELSRLSQTAGQGKVMRVSDDLWNVLQSSQRFARETDGAFDVTCGPVVSLWRKARREKVLPDPQKLKEATHAVGFDKLRLSDHSAELLVPYMRLDLGAIAKGYAADEAIKILRARGIRSALVSGGGDMAVSDAPPGARGWRIELAPLDITNAPSAEFVFLKNAALATSGDVFQHVEIDGVRYSHIVNPKTGLGLSDHSLVVVIATNCITADALSTSVSVLGPEKGLKYAESKAACARVLRTVTNGIEIRQSTCFVRYMNE